MSDQPSAAALREQVLTYVAGRLGASPETLDPARTVLSYVDSLKQLELIDDLEDRFGIELDETELFRIVTVGEFLDAVVRHIEGA